MTQQKRSYTSLISVKDTDETMRNIQKYTELKMRRKQNLSRQKNRDTLTYDQIHPQIRDNPLLQSWSNLKTDKGSKILNADLDAYTDPPHVITEDSVDLKP